MQNTGIDFDFYQKIFEKYIPFHQYMDFRLLEVQEGYAKALIPFKKELIGNAMEGNLHGGVLVAAMDSIAGLAGMTTIDVRKDKISTVDLRIDFLAPGKAKDVLVEAQVMKSGNRIVFTHSKVFHKNNPEKILAEGRAVFSVKRKGNSNE